jgi:hypothetical protein
VIVAVSAVLMMQPTGDQIIEMIAVRNFFVSAVIVRAGAFGFGANVRVRVADRHDAFVVMLAVRRVQMSVVNVIPMSVVLNSRMPAAFAVNVRVIRVCLTFHRSFPPFFKI